MGSAALSLAYVANGRFDAFVQNGGLSPWDVAAAGLIAERSGAVVSSIAGGPWWNPRVQGPRTSVVAAPRAQHDGLLELLSSLKTTVQTRR
jgi:myo-inositol-1(or 4)-monophosphatase